MNKLVLSGAVTSIEPLRYTPAGLPLLSFVLHHVSEVSEAGLKRKIECEVSAVMMGELANTAIQLGSQIKAAGFLAKRSAKSTQLVMHIQNIALI
ncbi:primosomal replication protein N [Methylophilaceae bacterium 11]|uniref:primosomal replication protein N n=1 Tax=unclassified Methylotenera TaxID=2643294 RepID=UPI00036E69A5|nr:MULTISPECIES: primosomal replication protein N [unclassified Methylotenera]EUJ10363.1 primosomal replication protein N [Methylophilaceae bacterium 11]